MKTKMTIFSAGLLILFVACSSSEVINEGLPAQTKQIGFSTHINKATRAAQTLTIDNLSKFYVYGMYKLPDLVTPIRLFDGTEVRKDGNTWKYDNVRNWSEGSTYNFFAYSNQNTTLNDPVRANLSADAYGNVIFNLVDYQDDNHQNDLIFAKANATGKPDGANDEVSLSFDHILSRLCIEFENKYTDGFQLTISNVQIYSVRNIGKFYGVENKWGEDKEVDRTPEGSHPTVKFNFTNDQPNTILEKEGSKGTTDFRYVIPYKYSSANVSIHFTVALEKDGNKVERNFSGQWTPNWVMGHSYRYKIAISGGMTGNDPIVFGVASVGSSEEGNEDGWKPGTTTIDGMTFTVD